jgi:asparagine synthase (glutamine-hydrolysing)
MGETPSLMCGIVGAVGAIDERVIAAVKAANQRMAHRGPDAEGIWSDIGPDGRGVVFGHRRLAIIDLRPESNQPMVEGRQALVFNGEIYNYQSLRKSLLERGQTLRTEGDTEVLLRSVELDGPAALDRLRGMFAFAQWDRDRRRLLLARDRIGEKPLYLTTIDGPAGPLLLFASEVRALLATELVPRRLDPVGLSGFLWNGFVPGPNTLVQGIRRLSAGTYAQVELADVGLEVSDHRYWRLPAASPRPDGDRLLGEELRRAVDLQLMADVPLGVFLSGGIDSSSVAALAVAAGRGPVRTFNLSFPDDPLDESRYAKAVAQGLGTDHITVPLDEGGFASQLDAALSALDQPTFDGINTYFVSRAAREAGVTVALAGTGGDELFGGYASFADLPKLRQASTATQLLPKQVMKWAGQAVARAKLGPFGEVPPQTRWGKLGEALGAGGDLVALYQLAYGLFLPDFLAELSDHAGRLPIGLPPALESHARGLVEGAPILHAISLLELTSFTGERLLPDGDAASMAVSLEVRVPLLDHRVIESVAAVDPERRFLPSRKKALLRELALGKLDPAIFDRPKSGFVLPIEGWCKKGLALEVGQTLSDPQLAQNAGLHPETVGRLWRAFSANAPGLYWSRIWALYVLLRWVREHKMSA